MTRRITITNLERQITEINHLAVYQGLSSTFVLDGAYGGYRLERYSRGPSGLMDACNGDPIGTGYVSKRELHDALSAFLAGMRLSGTCRMQLTFDR